MDTKLDEIKRSLDIEIKTFLLTGIKYNEDGIIRLKSVIKSTVDKVNQIEHIVTNIPIEHYLNNNNLTEEQKLYLDNCRNSRIIPNISIQYTFCGDVEILNLTVDLEKDDDEYWILI